MGYFQTQNDTYLSANRNGCSFSALVFISQYVSDSSSSHNNTN